MRKLFNNRVFKFISKLVETVFIFVMVIYIGFLVLQKISNNKAIMGYHVFTIATGSMKPIYDINDVILVKELDYDKLKVGDDVSYFGTSGDFNGKIITHRVVELDKEKQTLTTKGVANEVADPVINYSQLYGKVTYKFVVISFLTKIVRTKIGFYFTIFVPLCLVIFLEIADAITKMKDDENEETSEGSL